MLDARIRNAIARHYEATPADVTPEALAAIRFVQLSRIPGIGFKSRCAIRAWMREAGYRPSRFGWKRDAIAIEK